jgi:hypothetical protein
VAVPPAPEHRRRPVWASGRDSKPPPGRPVPAFWPHRPNRQRSSNRKPRPDSTTGQQRPDVHKHCVASRESRAFNVPPQVWIRVANRPLTCAHTDQGASSGRDQTLKRNIDDSAVTCENVPPWRPIQQLSRSRQSPPSHSARTSDDVPGETAATTGHSHRLSVQPTDSLAWDRIRGSRFSRRRESPRVRGAAGRDHARADDAGTIPAGAGSRLRDLWV